MGTATFDFVPTLGYSSLVFRTIMQFGVRVIQQAVHYEDVIPGGRMCAVVFMVEGVMQHH